jgi:hypothetical protein
MQRSFVGLPHLLPNVAEPDGNAQDLYGFAAPRLFGGDNQFAEAAQDIVQRALFFLDVESSDPARQRGEQGPHLQLGEALANAHVRPRAECHVTPRIVSPDIEAIGIGKLSRIAIGGAVKDNRARALRQHHAIQIIVTRHVARETLDRRFDPQDLVDCTGDQ